MRAGVGGQNSMSATVLENTIPSYAYLQGLPATSSCILFEIMIVEEFVPTFEELLYVPASSEGRLSVAQNQSLEQTLSTPKI